MVKRKSVSLLKENQSHYFSATPRIHMSLVMSLFLQIQNKGTMSGIYVFCIYMYVKPLVTYIPVS